MIKAPKSLSYSFILFALLAFSNKSHAISASADMENGYSGEVLTKVLQNYTKTPDASGYAQVLVRIGKDGRPFSCEMVKESNSYRADEAICIAVALAQQFPMPPNNAQSAEVYLTFVYDDKLIADSNNHQILSGDTLGENINTHTQLNSHTQLSAQYNDSTYNSTHVPTSSEQNFATEEYQSAYDNTAQFTPENNQISSSPLAEHSSENLTQTDTNTDELFSPSKNQPLELEPNSIPAPVYSPAEQVPNQSLPANSNQPSYAEKIMANAQKNIKLPEDLPLGIYKIQVKLRIDDTGKLINYTVLESSKNTDFDEHIKEVLLSDGIIPAPTSGNQEVILSFEARKE